MPKMIVDPYLYCLPEEAELDKDALIEFALRLGLWNTDFPKRSGSYFVSRYVDNVLWTRNRYPQRHILQNLLRKFDVTHFSANDILTGGNLHNILPIEMEIGVDEEFADDKCQLESPQVLPEHLWQRLPSEVSDAFVRSLVLISDSIRSLDIPDHEFVIATADLHVEKAERLVRVSAQLRNLHGATLVGMRDWPVVVDPEHLYADESIVDVFENDLDRAIRIAACRLGLESGVDINVDLFCAFRFGRNFTDSANYINQRRRHRVREDLDHIFRAIVAVLAELPNYTYAGVMNHALLRFVGIGPQLTRNVNGRLDRAARIRVHGEGEWLHIHYWLCGDGSIEFSNVTLEHNDATIYE